MESNNDGSSSGLISFYHPQLRHQPSAAPPAAAAGTPSNGVVSHSNNSGGMLYPHSVPSSAVSSPLENVKRKRGRPRKYGTPEQAAVAKRLSAASSSAATSTRKRDVAAGASAGITPGASAYSSKKSQLSAFGTGGHGFCPHIITVADGDDVNQKIMMFMQQSQREVCIMSASGSVSNISLRQPATSGGNISYQGRFDIISLSGSYIHTENGGKTGGLAVCLSSSDGQIIGGGVGGPLTAAGPIQIIVGTFLIDNKKDIKGDAVSAGKLPSPVGLAPISDLNFLSPLDSTHQIMGSDQFVTQHPSMQLTSPHSMEWRGTTGFDMHQSPENGDYQHLSH